MYVGKHLQIRSLVTPLILGYWSEFSVDHPSNFCKASSIQFNFWVYARRSDWYLQSEWELSGCIRRNRSHSVIRELMQDLPCNDFLFRKCMRYFIQPFPRTSVSLTLYYTMTHWFCVPSTWRTSILVVYLFVRDYTYRDSLRPEGVPICQVNDTSNLLSRQELCHLSLGFNPLTREHVVKSNRQCAFLCELERWFWFVRAHDRFK